MDNIRIDTRLASDYVNSSLVSPSTSQPIKTEAQSVTCETVPTNTPLPDSLANICSLFAQNGSLASSMFDSLPHQENGPLAKRGRSAEHPCWDFMHKFPNDNCMVCRLCGSTVLWITSRNAMQHLRNLHPMVAKELENKWQVKMQLRSELRAVGDDTFRSEPFRKRGRTAEHPSWLYFSRIDKKSANCTMCGVHVAYACSGNLMKHLKSKHVTEFVVAQKEWNEILRRKKQLCEIRLLATANGNDLESPSEFSSYGVEQEGDDEPKSPYGGVFHSEDNEESSLDTIGKSNEELQEGTESIEKISDDHDDPSDRQTAPCSSASSFNDSADMSVGETVGRLLRTMDFPSSQDSIPCSREPRLITGELGSDLIGSVDRISRSSIRADRLCSFANRRIQSFTASLAEDLALFPLEKSLLYMRQIRKFMDERLVEREGATLNSDDDCLIQTTSV
ncbi:hypothetical protein AB6A40_003996 [Gnathostoma spinigerum]|uniref:BED-type domain-containing protein n=1 Tax=Gnathostoma spinigerum TaxID=75299 RepID=A0ABD6EL38_9BILA